METAYLLPFGGATSFAELREAEQVEENAWKMRDLTHRFQMLAENIMASDIEDKGAAVQSLTAEFVQELEDVPSSKSLWARFKELVKAPTKTEDGVSYPASDYAYVPDPQKPSTWKLRLAEGKPGKITVRQLGRAASALSPGGFRGNQVQLPPDKVASVKKRIRSEYAKLGVSEEDIPASVKKSFSIEKDKDGNLRWMAVYSNMFRDRDNPPEILSSDAHKEFVNAVDTGEYPYPEAWLWHVEGTRFGVADFVAYDDLGFALASGLVDKGKEDVAEALAADENLAVSHGMPRGEIRYDDEDPSVLVRYRTKEISPLPRTAAANELTGLIMEGNMGLPEGKKDFLREKMGEEAFEELQNMIGDKAKSAHELDLEFKEEETTQVEAEPSSEPEPEPEQEVVPYVTRDEVVEAVGAVAADFQEQIVTLTSAMESMAEQFKSVMNVVGELKKEDERKIADMAESTPAASLYHMIQERSVIGREQTRVDGRTKLANDGPSQKEAMLSTIPVVSELLKQGGDWRKAIAED